MYARAVDDAADRLRALRHEECEALGLAALALVLAVVAAEVRSRVLALPLFLGGLVVGALGMRALWRRWDLVERLSGDRDAYVIAEVRAYASRESLDGPAAELCSADPQLPPAAGGRLRPARRRRCARSSRHSPPSSRTARWPSTPPPRSRACAC